LLSVTIRKKLFSWWE